MQAAEHWLERASLAGARRSRGRFEHAWQSLSASRRCEGEWPSSADADVEDHTEANGVEACVGDPLFWCRGRPPRLVRDCGEGGVECGGDERDRAEHDQALAGRIVTGSR